LVVPPTKGNGAEGIEDAKPRPVISKIGRPDLLLEKVFVILVVLSSFDNILEALGAKDDPRAATRCGGGLHDKWPSESRELCEGQLDLSLVRIRGYDDGIRNLNPVRKKLEMHGRFVCCSFQKIIGIDDADRGGSIGAECTSSKKMCERLKALVFVRCPIQYKTKLEFPLLQEFECLVEVVLLDDEAREPSCMSQLFDEANEVLVVQPIPGKREMICSGCRLHGVQDRRALEERYFVSFLNASWRNCQALKTIM
jgi:hypothetical protein